MTSPSEYCPPGFYPDSHAHVPLSSTLAPPLPTHLPTSLLQNSPQISAEDLRPIPETPNAIPSIKAHENPAEIHVAVAGGHLTITDLAQLLAFVKDVAAGAIVPYMEMRMYALSEQLAHVRKGMARSLLSSTKKWFGGSTVTARPEKIVVSSGYSQTVGYVWDGVEAQMRRLGDVAFMLRDYDLASQTYNAIKR